RRRAARLGDGVELPLRHRSSPRADHHLPASDGLHGPAGLRTQRGRADGDAFVVTPAAGRPAQRRIRLKRVYDAPADDDGTRVLVERLWPRGVTRDAAAVDHWVKEL